MYEIQKRIYSIVYSKRIPKKKTIEGNKDSKHEKCVLKREKERKMV
jgi:hypothetical protein